MKLSKRISNTKTSATIAMSMKARELISQGKDVISLSAGEPDFDTPNHIKEAAIKSINAGNTKYTPVDGMLGLKESIVRKFKNENNLEYKQNQILVSAGCKQSIYNLCQAVLDKGDEVLIPSPYWVSYPEIVKLSDATPVFIETNSENNFKVTTKSDLVKLNIKSFYGIGFDIHRLIKNKKLYLGGIKIPFHSGLQGHSDGDVVLHAIIDGLLGAMGKWILELFTRVTREDIKI